MSKNVYEVKPSEWKKWGELRRHVFNETYATLLNCKTKGISNEQWESIAWAVASVAAEKAEEFVWE